MGLKTYSGTYASLILGVSQQTPQERQAGQLAEQINMLSDPASSLRRRSGCKLLSTYKGFSASVYIKLVKLGGQYYTAFIDTNSGKLSMYSFATHTEVFTTISDYYKAESRKSIKTTVSRDNLFIVNTDKVPTKEVSTTSSDPDPKTMGCITCVSGALSKEYSCAVRFGTYNKTFKMTTSASTAAEATTDWVATKFAEQFRADTTLNAAYTIDSSVNGKVCLIRKDGNTTDTLSITTSHSSTYMITSNTSRVDLKTNLPTNLPASMDNWICAVGTTGNSSYFQYDYATGHWTECGKYELAFTLKNEPQVIYLDSSGKLATKPLGISKRLAGDDDNNAYPKFIDYGITGISTYQSRLVLLSGSYVHLSKTAEYNQFMRTTVEELLDDDAIEVASASLSSAQWEYAIPFNKDLLLISLQQQAVIPANNTVLTPKTTVIYPSTEIALSVAVEPTVVARSVYYAYQRGTDYYQLGEMIPSDYAASQYYGQNLNDHLPLYATGTCTNISASTSNNLAIASSEIDEVFINQYLWSTNQRVQMAWHKWKFAKPLYYSDFINDYAILYFYEAATQSFVVCSMNMQYNMRDDKPIPYLDFFTTVVIGSDGKGTLNIPDGSNLATEDLVFIIYDDASMRHMEVACTVNGNTVTSPYIGELRVGLRYQSSFTLTPPFLKDSNNNVLAGTNALVHSFDVTTKLSGAFKFTVSDNYGAVVNNTDSTVLTWSEAELGKTLINSTSKVRIPCRTKLESTYCAFTTDSTTEFNVVSVDYTMRIAQRFQRL